MLSFYVKFVQTDRWTDRQTDNGKTICPRSFDAGHTNVYGYMYLQKGLYLKKI